MSIIGLKLIPSRLFKFREFFLHIAISSAGLINFCQSCVPIGSHFKIYSAPTIAKRKDFNVDGTPTYGYYEWSEWVKSDMEIPVMAPASSNVGWRGQNVSGASYNYEDETLTKTDPFVAMDVFATASEGTWPSTSKLIFYVSYIYEGMQESAVSTMTYDSTHTRDVVHTPKLRFEIRLRMGGDTGGTGTADGTTKNNFGSLNTSDGRGIN